MNISKYPVIAIHEQNMYKFDSEGPRGRIKKVVLYKMISNDLYNLGFGDWNEELQKVDDSTRSNNGDRDRVLTTVAYTALDFTNQFPAARIFIEGSTIARTRLYQFGIAANILKIRENFEVFGFVDEKWELFRRERNYAAFLTERKKYTKFTI